MKPIIEHLGKVSITVEGYYDNNKDYNRLCLVYDRFTGKSYISKKPVPRDISITDETYWMPLYAGGGGSIDETLLEEIRKKLEKLDDLLDNKYNAPEFDINSNNMHLYLSTDDNNNYFELDSNNHIHFKS